MNLHILCGLTTNLVLNSSICMDHFYYLVEILLSLHVALFLPLRISDIVVFQIKLYLENSLLIK